ncbi:MAG: DUF134 domain-containing protein [Candidatus Saganbacteria bacterium]|nr:DUF134 domain-containing protein [Candidatus Saganbacteria bacterium]
MSPRRRKWRFCHPFAGDTIYKPQAVPMSMLELVELGHDELEAMRLCDHEELDQQQAAEKMKVSRGTIQRLLYSGRKKLIGAIISKKAIKIIGGEHIVPPLGPAWPGQRGWGRGARWRGR